MFPRPTRFLKNSISHSRSCRASHKDRAILFHTLFVIKLSQPKDEARCSLPADPRPRSDQSRERNVINHTESRSGDRSEELEGSRGQDVHQVNWCSFSERLVGLRANLLPPKLWSGRERKQIIPRPGSYCDGQSGGKGDYRVRSVMTPVDDRARLRRVRKGMPVSLLLNWVLTLPSYHKGRPFHYAVRLRPPGRQPLL